MLWAAQCHPAVGEECKFGQSNVLVLVLNWTVSDMIFIWLLAEAKRRFRIGNSRRSKMWGKVLPPNPCVASAVSAALFPSHL